MKKTMVIALVMTFALFALCLTGCDNDTGGGGGSSTPAQPTVPQPKVITQTSGGLAFDGKVTIKTSDPYTVADWNALVANVITAFNAAYNAAPGAGKSEFRRVFANDAGAQIVLQNNLTNNYEIRAGEFKTLYLKTDSIATADYATAIGCMDAGSATVGKATPAKNRLFLA